MLRGIRHQFERWLARGATASSATLAVENGWYVGAERVVKETIRFQVHPAKADERAIDVDCEWVPVKEPLTLTGAEGKSYGGLTLRFAPGTNTAITIPGSLEQVQPRMELTLRALTRNAHPLSSPRAPALSILWWLGGVDFAQDQHVVLHRLAAASDAAVFDQNAELMLLAVFEPRALRE